MTSSLCDEFTCNRGTTEGDNHRAILACTPNATPPPTTLKTLHKNNNKQLVCLTSSIRRVSCRTQTTLFAIYSTRCGDKRCQQGSVVDAKSLIRSVVTNVIGGITCAVCTYNLYYDVVFIHTNYLDFFLHPQLRILPVTSAENIRISPPHFTTGCECVRFEILYNVATIYSVLVSLCSWLIC